MLSETTIVPDCTAIYTTQNITPLHPDKASGAVGSYLEIYFQLRFFK